MQCTITDETKKIIGANIRRLREKSGKSVIEAIEVIGMARAYWYEIENGVANPTVESLQQIADFFEVDVRDLFAPARKRA